VSQKTTNLAIAKRSRVSPLNPRPCHAGWPQGKATQGKHNSTEMTSKGHSMSLKMAPFDRSHRSSYWRSIVTMALSCIISDIKRNVGRDFFIPHLHSTPPWEFRKKCLVLGKQAWLGYNTLKRVWWYVEPFRHNAGTWRTDGRPTDRQNCSQYRASKLLSWSRLKLYHCVFWHQFYKI